MSSVLLRLYPYTPVLMKDGGIDPQSIHSKRQEVLLSLFTTALAATFLYRKSSYKWALIGTAVVGMLSYYVLSKLGKWVPKKIADLTVIQAFAQPNQSTLPMIRRAVFKRTELNAEVIKMIFSCSDIQKKKSADGLLC